MSRHCTEWDLIPLKCGICFQHHMSYNICVVYWWFHISMFKTVKKKQTFLEKETQCSDWYNTCMTVNYNINSNICLVYFDVVYFSKTFVKRQFCELHIGHRDFSKLEPRSMEYTRLFVFITRQRLKTFNIYLGNNLPSKL